MNTEKLIDDIINGMSEAIKDVDDGFYDTYKFVFGKNVINHPWTWARIISVINKIDGVTALAQDNKHFKPDVIVIKKGFDYSPILYVDYESPNSCNRKLVEKDVKHYINKCKFPNTPYLIITSLPNKKTPEWELNYTDYVTAANGHLFGETEEKKEQIAEEIRENPCRYWYNDWRKELKDYKDKMDNIRFANIASKEIHSVEMFPD